MDTLAELLDDACERYGHRPFLGEAITNNSGEKSFSFYSYKEFGQNVARSRAYFANLGLQKGDAMAIIADNSRAWAELAFAAFSSGITLTPMYESQSDEAWIYILNDCKAKALFVATQEISQRVNVQRERLIKLEHVLIIEDAAETQKRLSTPPSASVMLEADDLAALIYTSGTTGKPKGVMLSHHNFVSNVRAVCSLFEISGSDRSCSFLPWAHCFGLSAELFVLMHSGAQVAIAPSTKTLIEDFAIAKPTLLFAVPAVFQRVYIAVVERIKSAPAPLRYLIRRALKSDNQGVLSKLQHALVEKLFFEKVRARFGGALRFAISGGAKLDPTVGEFLDGIGIGVFEGYGLTETSPILTVNTPLDKKAGSVGKAIPGVTLLILDKDDAPCPIGSEGEICASGPNIMQGYLGRSDDTEDASYHRGEKHFFRTGDKGRLDQRGFLTITGRIKEQYKLENGKYVVPTPIENALSLSPLFLSVFLYGDGQPHNVVLLVLDEQVVKSRLGENATEAAIHEMIEEELQEVGQSTKSYARPRDFALIDEDFSVENGLLTPKLSKRRAKILERYGDKLQALYH